MGLVVDSFAPEWFRDVPTVAWDRSVKDLRLIEGVRVEDCLLLDDNPDDVAPGQESQWVRVEKFESPYPDTDHELLRLRSLLRQRLHAA